MRELFTGVGGATITVMSADGVSYWESITLLEEQDFQIFNGIPSDATITITKTGYLPYMSDQYIQKRTISGYEVNNHILPEIGHEVTHSQLIGDV